MIQITDTTLKITDNFIKSHNSISRWQINCSIYSEIVYIPPTHYFYCLRHIIMVYFIQFL